MALSCAIARSSRTRGSITTPSSALVTPGAPAATALSESMNRARVAPSAWCPIRVSGDVTHCLAVTGADITTHDFVAIQLFAARVATAFRVAALRLTMVHRERLAAVGEMAAVLAHEVRNPLASMKLRADLARTGGEATPAVARDLDDIASEIGRPLLSSKSSRLRLILTNSWTRPSNSRHPPIRIAS